MNDTSGRGQRRPGLKVRRVVCVWIAASVASCAALGDAPGRAADVPSLYEQSMQVLLARRFTAPTVSYLLIDATTGRLLAARWDDPTRPVPMGSLVKPFTALAYGRAHGFRYPEYECRGTIDGCWLPRGHGRVGIEQAIAYSCNGYFRRLAANVNPEDATSVARSFSVATGPNSTARAGELIGLGSDWKVAPVEMARAYCELASRAGDDGGTGEILRGMALSAERGTGQAITAARGGRPLASPRVLSKTGTGPCSHGRKAPGDGYVIALWPAESPRYALLVGVHGVPGARAAAVCGEMLRVILEGE